jgi:glycerol-3-phosphate O-acyltransferase
VAAALLSRVDRSISRSQVLETAELYLGFLRKMKVDVSLGGVEDREALLRALDLFTQDGIVRKGVEIDTSDPPFHVPPEKRIHLEFSKNMMVAHLAPISLYAWSLRTARCDRRMSTYGVFMFLFRLLKYEFLLPVDHPMKGYRWGREELETRGGDEIRDLCHLTLNTLEGFWVGASYLLKEMGEEWIKERKLIQEMIRWGKEMLKTGQIRCPESFTSATLQGWLRIALEERILKGEEGHSGEKRREKRLGKGPNFNRIEEMVETLQRILACG